MFVSPQGSAPMFVLPSARECAHVCLTARECAHVCLAVCKGVRPCLSYRLDRLRVCATPVSKDVGSTSSLRGLLLLDAGGQRRGRYDECVRWPTKTAHSSTCPVKTYLQRSDVRTSTNSIHLSKDDWSTSVRARACMHVSTSACVHKHMHMYMCTCLFVYVSDMLIVQGGASSSENIPPGMSISTTSVFTVTSCKRHLMIKRIDR